MALVRVFPLVASVILLGSPPLLSGESYVTVERLKAQQLWAQLTQSRSDLSVFESAHLIVGVPVIKQHEGIAPIVASAATLILNWDNQRFSGNEEMLSEMSGALSADPAMSKYATGPEFIMIVKTVANSYNSDRLLAFKRLQEIRKAKNIPYQKNSLGEIFAQLTQNYYNASALTSAEDKIVEAIRSYARARDYDVRCKWQPLPWDQVKECLQRDLPFLVFAPQSNVAWLGVGFIQDKGNRFLICISPATAETRQSEYDKSTDLNKQNVDRPYGEYRTEQKEPFRAGLELLAVSEGEIEHCLLVDCWTRDRQKFLQTLRDACSKSDSKQNPKPGIGERKP